MFFLFRKMPQIPNKKRIIETVKYFTKSIKERFFCISWLKDRKLRGLTIKSGKKDIMSKKGLEPLTLRLSGAYSYLLSYLPLLEMQSFTSLHLRCTALRSTCFVRVAIEPPLCISDARPCEALASHGWPSNHLFASPMHGLAKHLLRTGGHRTTSLHLRCIQSKEWTIFTLLMLETQVACNLFINKLTNTLFVLPNLYVTFARGGSLNFAGQERSLLLSTAKSCLLLGSLAGRPPPAGGGGAPPARLPNITVFTLKVTVPLCG